MVEIQIWKWTHFQVEVLPNCPFMTTRSPLQLFFQLSHLILKPGPLPPPRLHWSDFLPNVSRAGEGGPRAVHLRVLRHDSALRRQRGLLHPGGEAVRLQLWVLARAAELGVRHRHQDLAAEPQHLRRRGMQKSFFLSLFFYGKVVSQYFDFYKSFEWFFLGRSCVSIFHFFFAFAGFLRPQGASFVLLRHHGLHGGRQVPVQRARHALHEEAGRGRQRRDGDGLKKNICIRIPTYTQSVPIKLW